jgi:acyl-CoA synthetase (AMP-forming)/AMP-acid ligase II
LIPRFLSTILNNFSFGITIIESLSFFNSSRPDSASFCLLLPSKRNGFVTTETVSAPISFAACAIIGAAPVPVPPPSPEDTNTISAPSSTSLIAS